MLKKENFAQTRPGTLVPMTYDILLLIIACNQAEGQNLI